MCNNCYHSNGRNKKAWKCSHISKAHYALGVCQTCYQSKYSKNKKTPEIGSDSEQEEEKIENVIFAIKEEAQL